MEVCPSNVANVLCAEARSRVNFDCFIVPWIDNIVMATRTDTQLRALVAVFLKVSVEANVSLHEVEFTSAFLGFEVNQFSKEVRFAGAWLEKVRERRLNTRTVRDIAVLI